MTPQTQATLALLALLAAALIAHQMVTMLIRPAALARGEGRPAAQPPVRGRHVAPRPGVGRGATTPRTDLLPRGRSGANPHGGAR